MAIKIYKKFPKFNLRKLPKQTAQIFGSKLAKKIYIGLGFFVVILCIGFISFTFAYRGRIYPKTYLGELNFGGKTRVQTREILAKKIAESKEGELKYSWNQKDYVITLDELTVDYNGPAEGTVDDLYAVGRNGRLGEILAEKIKAIFSRNKVVARFGYENDKLDEYLTNIAKDIDKPEIDASVAFRDGEPYVTPEEIGQKFLIEENLKIALTTIGEFRTHEITPFFVATLYPKIDTASAEKALGKVNDLLAHKLTLNAREKTFKLEGETMEQIIGFKAVKNREISGATFSADDLEKYSLVADFDKAKIGEYLDKIIPEINQEAKDSQFKVSDGRVVAFGLSQTGYELEKDKSIDLIIEGLNTNKESIDLPVKETKPAIGSSDPTEAGIKELIGEGRTSWRGSPPNRIHNLTLGAKKISGTIIKPGEEFSTVHTLSPITASGGYLPELVIKNSTKVEPDIGGGLCQVSSTLFRAVIYSGLKVTARTAHSFRVSYYEPPVGMDATVFDPAPDFKFVNNMETPVLIWAIAGNNSLVFQFYGTKDGRKIEISTPVVGNYVAPGEPIYTESASMAAGEIRQVERALSGATASFTYKVTSADGKVLEKETYVSKYVPIPNSYLYGPGTTGIPGVEGASTEPTPTPPPSPSPTPFKKGMPTP